MARIKLSFPDDVFCFETRMPVRITDINGANHLGNDALISMLSEARAQFLVSYGIQEASKDGTGIIVTDLATMYQSESFFPEMLRFEVGVMDFNKYGGDFVFRPARGNGEIRLRLLQLPPQGSGANTRKLPFTLCLRPPRPSSAPCRTGKSCTPSRRQTDCRPAHHSSGHRCH